MLSNPLRTLRTIDSISDLLYNYDLQTVINLLNSMSLNARKYEGLHFALLTEGMHDPNVETAMQHFADGVISLSVSWEAGIASRRIVIKKMKGMIASTRSIPFSLQESGLVIETAVRIA